MPAKVSIHNKKVAFRLVNSAALSFGVVTQVEPDGFWIESGQIYGELLQDKAWGPIAKQIPSPVFFVPKSSLMFLIATRE